MPAQSSTRETSSVQRRDGRASLVAAKRGMTDCMRLARPDPPSPVDSWSGPRSGPRPAGPAQVQARPSRPASAKKPEPPPARGGCGEEIISYIPALRVFARSLCRDRTEADDLVQETLLRAIENIDRFEPGTNLRAWLFTILRNRFYSSWAKRKRERTGDADCVSAIPIATTDGQFWHLRMQEMEGALQDLPRHYRETIILVAVLGESYIQAAEILGCDIGTVKSRVSRARAALRDRLG